MSEENIENDVIDDIEFDFSDTIEPTVIEIEVETEEEQEVSNITNTTMEESTEEDIVAMQTAFISLAEIEESDVEDEGVDKQLLLTIYRNSGIDKPELVFNVTPQPSKLNLNALLTIGNLTKDKYRETFVLLATKVKELIDNISTECEVLPRDIVEKVESIRYRADAVQTNYITRDNDIINIFKTPLDEAFKLVENEYVASDDFKLIYKLCDEVLGMSDKSFSDIASYIEVLYKDWLKSLEYLTEVSNLVSKVSEVVTETNEEGQEVIVSNGYYDSTFRDKLDLINSRDRIESLAINTKRLKELTSASGDRDIFDIIIRVMFEEL